MARSNQNGPVHRDFHGKRIQFNGRCGSGDLGVSSFSDNFYIAVGARKVYSDNRVDAIKGKQFTCAHMWHLSKKPHLFLACAVTSCMVPASCVQYLCYFVHQTALESLDNWNYNPWQSTGTLCCEKKTFP